MSTNVHARMYLTDIIIVLEPKQCEQNSANGLINGKIILELGRESDPFQIFITPNFYHLPFIYSTVYI